MKRPDKELWPGITKAEYATYLVRAAPRMLMHLRDRPLTLVRMPDGVGGPRFFQKDLNNMPEWLEHCRTQGRERTVDYIIVTRPEDLIVLADQAAVELHGWTTTCSRPAHPDRIIWDLDPSEGDQFDAIRDTADRLCHLLEKRGAAPHVLLSGSRGIHVTIPLLQHTGQEDVNYFADAVARALVRSDPRLTMELRKAERKGRIFIDTLRNRRHQTAVIPYSARATMEGSVAAPIPREMLQDEDLSPRQYRMKDAEKWLQEEDPWQGFEKKAVPLDSLL